MIPAFPVCSSAGQSSFPALFWLVFSHLPHYMGPWSPTHLSVNSRENPWLSQSQLEPRQEWFLTSDSHRTLAVCCSLFSHALQGQAFSKSHRDLKIQCSKPISTSPFLNWPHVGLNDINFGEIFDKTPFATFYISGFLYNDSLKMFPYLSLSINSHFPPFISFELDSQWYMLSSQMLPVFQRLAHSPHLPRSLPWIFPLTLIFFHMAKSFSELGLILVLLS